MVVVVVVVVGVEVEDVMMGVGEVTLATVASDG